MLNAYNSKKYFIQLNFDGKQLLSAHEHIDFFSFNFFNNIFNLKDEKKSEAEREREKTS